MVVGGGVKGVKESSNCTNYHLGLCICTVGVRERHGDVVCECAKELVFKVITRLFVKEITINGSTIKVNSKE